MIQFPWVLVDYESEVLDLENLATFRDFTKPVGVQNPQVEQSVIERLLESSCENHVIIT